VGEAGAAFQLLANDGAMVDEDQAVKALAAISNKTRLRIVRLLIVAGAEGLRAGLYR
jgi:hypothetical protein